MDMKQVLTERFTAAIRKALPKTPLIGPKWFRFYPNGKPADFQFTGCAKLAKASKKEPRRIAESILRHVRLGDLDAEATLTADYRINVVLRNRTGASKDGGPSPRAGGARRPEAVRKPEAAPAPKRDETESDEDR